MQKATQPSKHEVLVLNKYNYVGTNSRAEAAQVNGFVVSTIQLQGLITEGTNEGKSKHGKCVSVGYELQRGQSGISVICDPS